MLGACGGDEKSSTYPPDKFGPQRVGFRYLDFHDAVRDRSAYTAVLTWVAKEEESDGET